MAFYFITTSGFSQKRDDSLYNKVLQNQDLLRVDIEKAYLNIETYLKEARVLQDQETEMTLLANICRYNLLKKDIPQLIKASEELKSKALEYDDKEFEVIAKRYFAEAYVINGMQEDAISILKSLLPILNSINPQTDNIKNTRGNVFINISNAYIKLGDYETAIDYLRQVEKEYQKINDEDELPFLYYLHYSNLSDVFLNLNIDSSFYYVNKSIESKPSHLAEDTFMVNNYIILGRIAYMKKDLPSAIGYLKNAEALSLEIGHRTYLQDIYKDLIQFYEEKENFLEINHYKTKLSELESEQIEGKISSLQVIIERERNRHLQKDKELKNNIIFIIIGFSVFITLLIGLFYFYKKEFYHKYNSLTNTNNNTSSLSPKSLKIYSELIGLVKIGDKSFMSTFKQAFPDFANNLKVINPDLAQSEIEFCALLKLNLSTKEIAKYKFIQPKTVQNKKYRLRKRLGIPNNTDIYHWLQNI